MPVDRNTRKAQVWDALDRAGGSGLTRSEIAKAVGLKKSPHFLSILREIVEAEAAYTRLEGWRSNAPVFRYYLTGVKPNGR